LDVAARGGNFVVAVVGGLYGRRENRQPIFGQIEEGQIKSSSKINQQIRFKRMLEGLEVTDRTPAATAQKKKKTLLRQLAIPHHTVVRSG
jgi:hypothetical protein